jgi:hypothetical protein
VETGYQRGECVSSVAEATHGATGQFACSDLRFLSTCGASYFEPSMGWVKIQEL